MKRRAVCLQFKHIDIIQYFSIITRKHFTRSNTEIIIRRRNFAPSPIKTSTQIRGPLNLHFMLLWQYGFSSVHKLGYWHIAYWRALFFLFSSLFVCPSYNSASYDAWGIKGILFNMCASLWLSGYIVLGWFLTHSSIYFGAVSWAPGRVSLTFYEFSNIFSRNLCITEIALSSWNFVRVPHALGTRTKFQLEILTIIVISGIVYFREIILES